MKNTNLRRSLTGAAFAGTVLLLASSAPGQNLFVGNYNTDDIYQYTPGGTVSTFATGMNAPDELAFDGAGNLFVANTAGNGGGGNIAEIAPGGTVSTFATGIDPSGIAFNSAGNLLEADYNSGNIYEFTPGGVRSTFATGFSFPISMAMNGAGDLFVGSGYGAGNGVITELTPGGTPTTFATGLTFPNGLTFNSAGNLFESDTSGNIYEFTPGGVRSTFAAVSNPDSLAFNSAGNLFVTTHAGPIIEITPGGTESTFATESGISTGLAFQPVPEPSVFAIAGIGAAAFFARRRK